jgi:hypothetical protein
MFAKFKLVAGVLAAVVALAPLPASAKTTVHVGIGVGGWGYPGWGYGHRCWNTPYNRCGWGYYHYRPYYPPVVNYYYNPYPAYGYPPPSAYRVSCGAAKSIVYRSGYGHVAVVDCGGKYHVFNATRNGHYFRLRVNAWNGGLVVVSRS